MKYYEHILEDFLLIRLVPTRYCNYRCEYCYVPQEKKERNKTMFSHHAVGKWLEAFEHHFSNRTLEFYFTGGEPLLVKDCISMVAELAEWKNVESIRIDSNMSPLEHFLRQVNSEKVKFLGSFHPTQVPYETFLNKVIKLRDLDMLGMVNMVASRENIEAIGMPPHALVERFKEMDMFLNIAKDFHRGFFEGLGYEDSYRRYVDILQYPLDNCYMNKSNLNRGFLCGSAKHYITINRHGQVFSCGSKKRRTVGHGNIFDRTLELPPVLETCFEECCPSIVSYSFSCSNDFSPTNHIADYVRRCGSVREGLTRENLDTLWEAVNIDNIFIKKVDKKMVRRLQEILK